MSMTRAAPIRHLSIIRATITSLLIALAAFSLTGPAAHAHPADEFCTPGGGLDPLLCRQLEALDSANRVAAVSVAEPANATSASLEARPWPGTLWRYVTIGVGHILPGGLDHILFVLALFLSTERLRPLLLQISAFTVAHTATLGLVAAGVFTPPASVVEPLIAATIAFVAVENLAFKEMPVWRPLIVFAFGLIHGMGFAGFFGELGLPDGQFWPALIGFNIGVEIGQLAVIGLAATAAFYMKGVLHQAGRTDLFRPLFVIPGSALIGAFGAWWAIERVFF